MRRSSITTAAVFLVLAVTVLLSLPSPGSAIQARDRLRSLSRQRARTGLSERIFQQLVQKHSLVPPHDLRYDTLNHLIQGPGPYELVPGDVLYHGTPNDFTHFDHRFPTWFTPMSQNAFLHAIYKTTERSGEAAVQLMQAVRANQPGAVHRVETYLSQQQFFVKKCTVQAHMRLQLFTHDDHANVRAFQAATDNQYVLNQLMALVSNEPSVAIMHSNYCHHYDGWRNPWDQDEVMLCPHQLPHLRCVNEYCCTYYDIFQATQFEEIIPVRFHNQAPVQNDIVPNPRRPWDVAAAMHNCRQRSSCSIM